MMQEGYISETKENENGENELGQEDDSTSFYTPTRSVKINNRQENDRNANRNNSMPSFNFTEKWSLEAKLPKSEKGNHTKYNKLGTISKNDRSTRSDILQLLVKQ